MTPAEFQGIAKEEDWNSRKVGGAGRSVSSSADRSRVQSHRQAGVSNTLRVLARLLLEGDNSVAGWHVAGALARGKSTFWMSYRAGTGSRAGPATLMSWRDDCNYQHQSRKSKGFRRCDGTSCRAAIPDFGAYADMASTSNEQLVFVNGQASGMLAGEDGLVTTGETVKLSQPPEYGDGPNYWNDRYTQKPEPFEWLTFTPAKGSELMRLIGEVSGGERESKILHVGCGNSRLPEALYDSGYHNIANIDSSEVVISQMQERNSKRAGMTWSAMDATRMQYDKDSFDLVLDKSLIDTLACASDANTVVKKYLAEVVRVLRPGGKLISVSFGTPITRRKFFAESGLTYTVKNPENPMDPLAYWIYIGEKKLGKR